MSEERKMSAHESSTSAEADKYLKTHQMQKGSSSEWSRKFYYRNPKGGFYQIAFNQLFTSTLHESLLKQVTSEESYLIDVANKIRKLDSSIERIKDDLRSCKKAIDQLKSKLEEKPIVKETSIFDIGDGFEVVEAIPIVIEEIEDEVIASVPELEVYGVGSGEPEALFNLKARIRDLYLDITSTPTEKLGSLPLGWRRILERMIRQVE